MLYCVIRSVAALICSNKRSHEKSAVSATALLTLAIASQDTDHATLDTAAGSSSSSTSSSVSAIVMILPNSSTCISAQ
jgi:hypothetical protein